MVDRFGLTLTIVVYRHYPLRHDSGIHHCCRPELQQHTNSRTPSGDKRRRRAKDGDLTVLDHYFEARLANAVRSRKVASSYSQKMNSEVLLGKQSSLQDRRLIHQQQRRQGKSNRQEQMHRAILEEGVSVTNSFALFPAPRSAGRATNHQPSS